MPPRLSFRMQQRLTLAFILRRRMHCNLAPMISRLHASSSCQKMVINMKLKKQNSFTSCGRLRRRAGRVSTLDTGISCGGAIVAAYGPPLVRIMPGTCGCAASLKRRSGLSNRATQARSCPARSWSSYCRSQTDKPRGSRWRRDLCLRLCVQPWLELGKLGHWRLWR